MAWQVDVPTGQVNFRGSLTRSANNVLQPMLQLHPVWDILSMYVVHVATRGVLEKLSSLDKCYFLNIPEAIY